jgi:hypothetical protein
LVLPTTKGACHAVQEKPTARRSPRFRISGGPVFCFVSGNVIADEQAKPEV